jgi:hypothetical protein
MDEIFNKIKDYTTLTPEAKLAWMKILNRRKYSKGSFIIMTGDIA